MIIESREVTKMASSLKRQVGGTHYIKSAIQPIEYIQANKLGFVEGNIVKYVTRYKHKNGLEDLEKAKHYVDLLIDDYKKSQTGERELKHRASSSALLCGQVGQVGQVGQTHGKGVDTLISWQFLDTDVTRIPSWVLTNIRGCGSISVDAGSIPYLTISTLLGVKNISYGDVVFRSGHMIYVGENPHPPMQDNTTSKGVL